MYSARRMGRGASERAGPGAEVSAGCAPGSRGHAERIGGAHLASTAHPPLQVHRVARGVSCVIMSDECVF